MEKWDFDEQGKAIVHRTAEHWRPIGNGVIECDLCYRSCRLDPGQAGWCKIRGNQGGEMTLTDHGVLSALILQRRGFQVDPFMTYKPGALSLFVGGVSCTSKCTFCMSKEITWNPAAVPWLYGIERTPAMGLFYTMRGLVHPAGLINLAKMIGCTQIEFGINEPLLTYEYTLDAARLACEAGLEVVIETNGFSKPEVVHELAPYVAAVDLGVKGGGDPVFYDRWMKSPGAMDVVKESALAWRKAGVHLIIGDVIAPMQLQSDQAFKESTREFYSWVRDHLGELTEILPTPLLYPGASSSSNKSGYLLPSTASRLDETKYTFRLHSAVNLARDLGLPYAHHKTVKDSIRCHQCGSELLTFLPPSVYCEPCLMPFQFCDRWGVIQYVDEGGYCSNCGTKVPVVPQSQDEIERMDEALKNLPDELVYKGKVVFRPVMD